jgi:hypothetical protein
MPRGIPNRKGITNTEIVRQALAELGRDAKPREIRVWAKKKLKVTLNPNNISAYKTLLNKQAAEATGQVSSPVSGESGINKMEAVRRALNRLGNLAKPADIQEFIRSELGMEVETQLISNYKGLISKKAAGQSNLLPRLSGRTLAGIQVGGFSIEEIQTVKEVVDKMGADKVRQLAQVLAQ